MTMYLLSTSALGSPSTPLVSLYVYIASMTLVLFLFEHIVHMNYLLCNISCSPFNLAFVLAAQHKQYGIII